MTPYNIDDETSNKQAEEDAEKARLDEEIKRIAEANERLEKQIQELKSIERQFECEQ